MGTGSPRAVTLTGVRLVGGQSGHGHVYLTVAEILEAVREVLAQDIWDAYRDDPASIDPTSCRNIQDTAYLLRRHGPRVPAFFYKLRRPATEAAMAAGPTALRSRSGEHEDDGSEQAS